MWRMQIDILNCWLLCLIVLIIILIITCLDFLVALFSVFYLLRDINDIWSNVSKANAWRDIIDDLNKPAWATEKYLTFLESLLRNTTVISIWIEGNLPLHGYRRVGIPHFYMISLVLFIIVTLYQLAGGWSVISFGTCELKHVINSRTIYCPCSSPHARLFR